MAHAKRHIKTGETLSKGSKQLTPLREGHFVSIQDQTGHTPRRWSKTGKVLESLGHDSYLIKVDGANRSTKRNRKFLRQIVPYAADTDIPNINMWKVDSPGVTVHATEYIDSVDLATPPRLEQPHPTFVQEKSVNMPTMTDTIPPTSHNMPTPAQAMFNLWMSTIPSPHVPCLPMPCLYLDPLDLLITVHLSPLHSQA